MAAISPLRQLPEYCRASTLVDRAHLVDQCVRSPAQLASSGLEGRVKSAFTCGRADRHHREKRKALIFRDGRIAHDDARTRSALLAAAASDRGSPGPPSRVRASLLSVHPAAALDPANRLPGGWIQQVRVIRRPAHPSRRGRRRPAHSPPDADGPASAAALPPPPMDLPAHGVEDEAAAVAFAAVDLGHELGRKRDRDARGRHGYDQTIILTNHRPEDRPSLDTA